MKIKVAHIVFAIIVVSVLWYFMSKSTIDSFSGGAGLTDASPTACIKDSRSCSTCDGAPEGQCTDNGMLPGGGWNNSISRDFHEDRLSPFDENSPKADGKPRVFKNPAYYGFGCAQRFCYGEPFYMRTEKY